MSPLSIPGIRIHIPYEPGQQKCKFCGRSFSEPKIKATDTTIIFQCPYCKATIKEEPKPGTDE